MIGQPGGARPRAPGFLEAIAERAVEDRRLAADGHPVDFAEVGAGLAYEGAGRVLPVGQVKASKARRWSGTVTLAGQLLPSQQGRPDRSGDIVVWRHGNRPSGESLEGRHYRRIGGHPALKEDTRAQGPPGHDPVEVVLRHSVGQPAHQVGLASPLLLVVHQVRLHEHGAALAQRGGLPGAEGQVAELLAHTDA